MAFKSYFLGEAWYNDMYMFTLVKNTSDVLDSERLCSKNSLGIGAESLSWILRKKRKPNEIWNWMKMMECSGDHNVQELPIPEIAILWPWVKDSEQNILYQSSDECKCANFEVQLMS